MVEDSHNAANFAERARELVEQRRDDPEFVSTYDRDGDGTLDDEELEEARRAVEVQLRTEARAKRDEEVEDDETLVGERLQGRFEVVDLLGVGGQGATWLARDLDEEREVAVKELDLGEVDDWKALERFQREIEAYDRVAHPGVPSLIDSFRREETEGTDRHFLVREYAEGRDLESLLEAGEHYTEDEARQLAEEVLEILDHLHGLDPPVIHRDVKPANLVIADDGTIQLVDFGAVHALIPDEEGGSTMVGTSGYMPVEQMMGRAVPQTDLYALGATLVRRLSRRSLVDIPMERMKLQYDSYVDVSGEFTEFLDRLLAPYPEERFNSAGEALDALEGRQREEDLPSVGGDQQLQEAPSTTTFTIEATALELEPFLDEFREGRSFPKPDGTDFVAETFVEVPDAIDLVSPRGPSGQSLFGCISAALPGIFGCSLGCMSMIIFLVGVGVLSGGENVDISGVPGGALTVAAGIFLLGGVLLLLGIGLGRGAYSLFTGFGDRDRTEIRLSMQPDAAHFIRNPLLGFRNTESIDIEEPRVELQLKGFEDSYFTVFLRDGDDYLEFGEDLAAAESLWLASEIRDYYGIEPST